MTHCRQIMLEELQRRNFAPTTIATYLHAVERFARHFKCRPDRLNQTHFRSYQAYLLRERKLRPLTVRLHVAVWVPDAAHEALRDLVRARGAAKKDQLRARHRPGKFLLRQGRRPPTAMKPWTQRHLTWLNTVHFEHAAQEATLLDYLHEVEHVTDRIKRLERAVDEAVQQAPPQMRAVIEALQALRGIAQVSAVTIVAEVGELSRFAKPRQLMGYTGAVASEDSSGERTHRGAITKAGNAHLRHIVVEAAWAYRHPPSLTARLRKRQALLDDAVKAIAWKAQHRLHARYRTLTAKGKCSQQAVTAVARELLGFIWAIGVAVEAKRHDARSAAA